MIVLDTDHISVRQHESPAAEALRRQIVQVDDEVVTTVVTYEEQMRSWLSRIGRTRNMHNQVPFYLRLAQMADFFGAWRLLTFTDAAADRFQSLRQEKVRISSTDLKVASIVLVEGATLLSRNLVDFEQVPGLVVENWLPK